MHVGLIVKAMERADSGTRIPKCHSTCNLANFLSGPVYGSNNQFLKVP